MIVIFNHNQKNGRLITEQAQSRVKLEITELIRTLSLFITSSALSYSGLCLIALSWEASAQSNPLAILSENAKLPSASDFSNVDSKYNARIRSALIYTSNQRKRNYQSLSDAAVSKKYEDLLRGEPTEDQRANLDMKRIRIEDIVDESGNIVEPACRVTAIVFANMLVHSGIPPGNVYIVETVNLGDYQRLCAKSDGRSNFKGSNSNEFRWYGGHVYAAVKFPNGLIKLFNPSKGGQGNNDFEGFAFNELENWKTQRVLIPKTANSYFMGDLMVFHNQTFSNLISYSYSQRPNLIASGSVSSNECVRTKGARSKRIPSTSTSIK